MRLTKRIGSGSRVESYIRTSARDLRVVELESDGAGGRVVALVRVLSRRRRNLVAVGAERQAERLHLRCGRYTCTRYVRFCTGSTIRTQEKATIDQGH